MITNIKEFEEYVINKYPQEACGIVVNDVFYPTENTHKDPVNFFKFSEAADRKLSLLQEPYKIIHSHTMESYNNDPRIPSYEDMLGQVNTNVEWGIVHCDGTNVTDILWFGKPKTDELLGRKYVPNVYDCFTLARDYFWQERQIDIGSHPRPVDWESWNKDYILQTYSKLGFIDIELDSLQPGDVVLFAIGSDSLNHIGIYEGEDKYIHHLYNRTSSRDTLSKWKRQFRKALRLL